MNWSPTINKVSAKYDWEQNRTEVHPPGAFYFDTLRMSSLYLWREFEDL